MLDHSAGLRAHSARLQARTSRPREVRGGSAAFSHPVSVLQGRAPRSAGVHAARLHARASRPAPEVRHGEALCFVTDEDPAAGQLTRPEGVGKERAEAPSFRPLSVRKDDGGTLGA